MAKALKSFTVTARMILITSVDIKAESHEDALAQSRALRESDFVKFKGEYIDGSMSIASIGKTGYWETEQD